MNISKKLSMIAIALFLSHALHAEEKSSAELLQEKNTTAQKEVQKRIDLLIKKNSPEYCQKLDKKIYELLACKKIIEALNSKHPNDVVAAGSAAKVRAKVQEILLSPHWRSFKSNPADEAARLEVLKMLFDFNLVLGGEEPTPELAVVSILLNDSE